MIKLIPQGLLCEQIYWNEGPKRSLVIIALNLVEVLLYLPVGVTSLGTRKSLNLSRFHRWVVGVVVSRALVSLL